jgi:hypothetical protein
VAKLDVLARRQGLEHGPLVEQLLLDQLDPGQDLQAGPRIVRLELRNRGAQFVDDQLEPELRGLVLDDEQQLVVMNRA